MPIFQKTKKLKADPMPIVARRPVEFKAPSPADVVPEIARLEEKEVSISESIRADRTDVKRLDREIAADDSKELHSEIAKLLGDQPSPKAAKRRAIADAKHRIAVAEAALGEIAKRRRLLETEAGKAVCAAVRPEIATRIKVLVSALRAVDAAHFDLGEALLAIEAEGVSWGTLGAIKPHWLGDHREDGRRIVSYIKEVAEAGYAV